MATNGENIRRIVDTALNDQAQFASDFIELLRRAWIQLSDRRCEPGRSTDLDLAAAEHYLLARYLVASGEVGEAQMSVIAEGYYGKKFWDSAFANSSTVTVTSNPVSQLDLGVVAWGVVGAKHGAADHARHHVSRSPPFWRPVDELPLGESGKYGSVGTATTSE